MRKTIRTMFVFIYGFIILSLFSALAQADKPKAMTPLDVINLQGVSSPKLSPDGSMLVYTKRKPDWKANKNVSNLWLSDARSGEDRQLTFNVGSETGSAWSPNGRFVSFLAKREKDKHRKIYFLPLAGGETYSVVKHESDIEKYVWTSDGGAIYFLANEPLTKKIADRKKQKDDMFPYEVSLSYRHIWRFDLDKKSIQKITTGEFFVRDFTLSNDNKLIAYNRATELRLDDWHGSEVWVASATGKQPRKITDNTFAEQRIEISPDNKNILFISDINEKGEYYYDANLFVLSIAKGTITPIAIDQTFQVQAARWSQNGDSIYIRANMGVHSQLWVLGVNDGSMKQLTEGVHTVKGWNYNRKAGLHAFILTTPYNPGDAWSMSANGGELTALTQVHTTLKDKYRLPEQRIVRWKSYDGTQIEGLLTLPLNYKKGKRYPLITQTHGGPRLSDQYGQYHWRAYIPAAAAMGYAYFSPNYRGGRGNGDDFMRDMVGGYFNNSHLDVMSGIDYLIEQGFVDPDRLVAKGWSAGGHMTNKLITVTDRFKAASSGAGAVDWVSMYGETDLRDNRTPWFGGSPWQKDAPLDVYLKNSPLKDMWKVKTPTLIFVGERDKRVPPTQSLILFRALQDLGVESELYVAPRERHGFRELRHRLFVVNREIDWFEHYLHNRDYKWDEIPE